ncbi:MAG TPA: hypothetical protein PLC04_07295 [Candidatus Kapabacteria bacterium]|nr:hypothetical protein [Candidatus Kapabacteria bacterium]
MKTKIENFKIFAFVIIIAIFLVIVTNDSHTQPPSPNCPPGYVYLEQNVNVNVGGIICNYKVGICVLCPAGPYPIQFTVVLKTFEPYPIDCGINPSLAKATILGIITNPEWIDANIGKDCFAGWGPCQWNPVLLTIVSHSCWKKIKYFDDEYNEVRINIAACDDDYCTCQRTDTICWNKKKFDILKDKLGWHRVPRNCTSYCYGIEEPPDGSFPDPTEEEPFPESICFQLADSCNSN